MTYQAAENLAIMQKWLQRRKSSNNREKEETKLPDEVEDIDAAFTTQGMMDEKNEVADSAEGTHTENIAKFQTIFSMVKNQTRLQDSQNPHRMGILDALNQIKEMEKNKQAQFQSTPTVKITSSEEETEDHVAPKDCPEEQMTGENKKPGMEELCVVMLEEILLSLDSLKKDLRAELAQLRCETQSYTEKALSDLENRLTSVLKEQEPAHPARSRNHTAEPAETPKRRPPSMPLLGTSRRRVLNRTMTTITPKTCPPFTLGPRSNSDPLGGWASEAVSDAAVMSLKRDEVVNQSPGPLPPVLPQKGKKALRGRSQDY